MHSTLITAKHAIKYINYALECKQSATARKKYNVYAQKIRFNRLGICEVFPENRQLIETRKTCFKLSL